MGGRHGKLLAFVMSFSYFNCPRKTFISMRRINGVGVERCGKTRQVEIKADTVWGGSVSVALLASELLPYKEEKVIILYIIQPAV